MVRNRRQDTGLEWTNRHVQIIPIDFTKEEQEVYDMISELKHVSSVFSAAFSYDYLAKGNVLARRKLLYETLTKMRQRCVETGRHFFMSMKRFVN